MEDLQAIRTVDFDWTMHVESVWHDQGFHIPALHRDVREEILTDLNSLHRSGKENPLGRVVVGAAGSGKTHLLGSLRKEALATGARFVMVDMTDVRDFWETVLQGFLGSLFQPVDDDRRQFEGVLEQLIGRQIKVSDGGRIGLLKLLRNLKAGSLGRVAGKLVLALRRKAPQEVLAHRDTIRALMLLASNHPDLEDIGYGWLQGLEVQEEEQRRVGFRSPSARPVDIVRGLSWIMSQGAPTLLVFDQLDAIVTEHNIAYAGGPLEEMTSEQRASLAIIEGISGGMMALRDITKKTLTVVSCLEETWENLRKMALRSATDRFRPPMTLKWINSGEVARKMVELRLREGYRESGFQPPYPSWPFRPEAFDEAGRLFPRQVLKLCDRHRDKCLRLGKVSELQRFGVEESHPPPTPLSNRLDERFEALRDQADVAALLAEKADDQALSRLLQIACHCLLREEDLPEEVDGIVDVDFPGAKTYPSLHARVRLIYRAENDREKHYAFRALQRRNPIAFQNRLKAAMTAAGIDRQLGFRRLVIVRTEPLPSGRVTKELLCRFHKAGGVIHALTEDELRALWAIAWLDRENDPELASWLRKRKPLCRLRLMQQARLCHGAREAVQGRSRPPIPTEKRKAPSVPTKVARKPGAGSQAPTRPVAPPPTPEALERAQHQDESIHLGRRLIGDRPGEALRLKLAELTRHTVILAGSGSGKTVLIRRLVEEAALAGLPSIVIDGANDLARLGDRWPEPPPGWEADDPQKAKRYGASTEVLVWTPGLEGGNPLHLEVLPDLAAMTEDADDLNQAIDLVRQTLQGVVAQGSSARAKSKHGVLAAALKYFAHYQGGRLSDLITLLSDLPPEAGGAISNAEKLAREMADSLRAETEINVLLQQIGTPMDPSSLFDAGEQERTRISVINMTGLPSLESQQQFVAQLAMQLFTWVKAHPAPVDAPVRGLLVIDEAKDFIPAGRSVPCKAALLRLTAQARKYGLGLIFASQAPKSIDHNVIANCTTHFYGKANSPAAIAAVQDQLKQRGGQGGDIARLKAGQFYLHTEAMTAPQKLTVPMCLSYHPATPLDEAGVLERAVTARSLSALSGSE